MSTVMIELGKLRADVEYLRRSAEGSRRKTDAAQRRMASRVLQLIDARLEALDRVGCESEDVIAPELQA